jgi:hypothetical protein
MDRSALGVATAALDQPGDEGWAYGRRSAKWQRLTAIFERRAWRWRPLPVPAGLSYRKANLMMITTLKRSVSFAFAAAALLAASPGQAAPTSFDGAWSVTIVTQSGNCDAAYNFPLRVSGGRISSGGNAAMNGRVSGAGAVSVSISSGGSSGRASGRLACSSGAGSWSGILSGSKCSGRWEAHR